MKKEEMLKVLQSKADEFGFDGTILEAIISVESQGWRPSVACYEKGWPYTETPEKFAKANGISVPTETVLQQISWGLGQIMGGTARGLGYSGPLTELIDPETNLHWCSVYFKMRCDKYEGIAFKIAAYNAGTPKVRNGVFSNQKYVDEVLSSYKKLELAKRFS